MERKRFAWWPVRVTSGKLVWLTKYIQHRILYDSTTGRPPLHGLYFEWTETEAEETWRLLKEQRVDNNRNIWNTPKGL